MRGEGQGHISAGCLWELLFEQEALEQKAQSWDTMASAGRGCHRRLSDSEKPRVERDYEVNSKESCERAGEQRQVTAVCQQEPAKASKAWVTRAK